MKTDELWWRIDGRMRAGEGRWTLAGYFRSRREAEKWQAQMASEHEQHPGKCWAETRLVAPDVTP